MARPFAVFDVDGTVIRWQLFHAIFDSLARQGNLSPALHDEIKASRMLWKRRTHEESFKEYEAALVKAYEQALTKLKVADFQAAAQAVFDEYKEQGYRYTRDLIKRLKAKNYVLLAISGSQAEIVGMLAKYYDFDDYAGTTYEQIDGRFSGQRQFAAAKKPELLASLMTKHDLVFEGSIAVGDSEGDIPMLELVEQPIAFNPSKLLFDHAKQKQWKVVVERKNMVYELESRDGSYILAQTNLS